MDKIEYPTKFTIDKVQSISLVNKETGEIVYSAPHGEFAVVSFDANTMTPEVEKRSEGKCPMLDTCTCKTAMCRVYLPDESCYWYRYFKNLIEKNERKIGFSS